jgi:NAD(P)-dependent dehydrogenase (short-subunit alcohol dehydrogenase family)
MNKVALVTGASSGIGEAIAIQLLAQGWTVFAAARRMDRMSALGQKGARLIPLDLESDASIMAAMATLLDQAGRIDALVNNAGYGAYGALEDVPLAEARRQFEVNLFGLARLIQLALPAMRQQGMGRIVNISSIGGRIHEPMGTWYHATKFAVEGLSDCLRMELAPYGIDVVVAQPGAIKTEWGGIARESLLSTSGAGAYADLAHQTAGLLAAADKNNGSPPEVVADAVNRALSARRPKTRYVVGAGAKPLIALRRLTTDRGFDRIMHFAAKLMAQRTDRMLS